jgi:hypothetical protein
MSTTEIIGMTGDPKCDCKFCGCASGFHEDSGECWNCLDDGKECPGYEPMEADDG